MRASKFLLLVIFSLFLISIVKYTFPHNHTINVIPQAQQLLEEEEKWRALDEIIEKFAKEQGKNPTSFIELEGDLLLFVFSLFSGIAGFIIGYYTRVIFAEKKDH